MISSAPPKPTPSSSNALVSNAPHTSHTSARVVATFGRQCLVATPDGKLLEAVRRGKRTDVVVGDQVELAAGHTEPAVIEAIAPRTSLLFRADTVRTKEMAANIDQVAIVYAPQPTYSETFIWRALAAASAANLNALVILNKRDLIAANPPSEATRHLLETLGYPTLLISAKHDAAAARQTLLAALSGRATLLAGQSGMGKSTVLNLLVPHAAARTQEFSTHLNLGKQTTTASRWFDLTAAEGGGALVDSPGFQAFGLSHLSPGEAAQAMPDLMPFLGQCRFNDCKHLEEPGCAIRAAVTRGEIQPSRYAFYRELAQEAMARPRS